jgi:hypothetical protein
MLIRRIRCTMDLASAGPASAILKKVRIPKMQYSRCYILHPWYCMFIWAGYSATLVDNMGTRNTHLSTTHHSPGAYLQHENSVFSNYRVGSAI